MDMLHALDAMYSFGYCSAAFHSSNGTYALCSDSDDNSLLPPLRSLERILRTSQEKVTLRSRVSNNAKLPFLLRCDMHLPGASSLLSPLYSGSLANKVKAARPSCGQAHSVADPVYHYYYRANDVRISRLQDILLCSPLARSWYPYFSTLCRYIKEPRLDENLLGMTRDCASFLRPCPPLFSGRSERSWRRDFHLLIKHMPHSRLWLVEFNK